MPKASCRIFICYRRAETADNADIIHDYLQNVFPAEGVFRDIDSLTRGVDFGKEIEAALSECDVVLVIIGDKWIDITDEQGRTRLHQPDDHVRHEVACALKKEPPYVLPVFVRGARMPAAADLPDDLQGLPPKNGLAIRPRPDRDRDLEDLCASIRSLIGRAAEYRRILRDRQEKEAEDHRRRQESVVESAADMSHRRTGASALWGKPLDEFDWDQLLETLHDRSVVPVLGPDLSIWNTEDQFKTNAELAAHRIAADAQIAVESGLAAPLVLEAIIAAGGEEPSRVAWRWLHQLRDLSTPPSQAIRTVVEGIRASFWLTTARDLMLEAAFKEVPDRVCQRWVFDPDQSKGVPESEAMALLVQLLGACDRHSRAAVSEEEEVEWLFQFLHGPISEQLRRRLRKNDLLFLGGGHPPRFAVDLLRAIYGNLSFVCDRHVWLHESALPQENADLRAIYRFRPCRVISGPSVGEFVNELVERFKTRFPDPLAQLPQVPSSDYIFISYASEDRQAVERLAGALRNARLECWVDTGQLAAGDEYDARIRKTISRASLFLPIISCHSSSGGKPRFFRKEWHWAIQEAQLYGPSEPFIVPVLIDDTSPSEGAIPEQFIERQWTRCIGGDPQPDFVRRLVDIMDRRRHMCP